MLQICLCICSELLKWWEISSDVDKLICRECIYTQLTSSGRSECTDRSMEKSQCDIMRLIGYLARCGYKSKLEYACMVAPDQNNDDVIGLINEEIDCNRKKNPILSKPCAKLLLPR